MAPLVQYFLRYVIDRHQLTIDTHYVIDITDNGLGYYWQYLFTYLPIGSFIALKVLM
jgi:hypothetical protein